MLKYPGTYKTSELVYAGKNGRLSYHAVRPSYYIATSGLEWGKGRGYTRPMNIAVDRLQ